VPKDISITTLDIEGISAAWFSCTEPKDGVVLYLHGGAYALGSINTHREFLGRFATAARRKVLAINYRLAPEHPFPAALEDSTAFYQWLLSEGLDSTSLVIAGDSAGGGLALATALALRDAGESLPACMVCLSPWVDLTLSSPTRQASASADPLLNRDVLARYAALYAGEHEKDDRLISPLFADLAGLPPTLIHVGTDEILLDDTIRLAGKAQQAGVEVQLIPWEGMFHVFQMMPFLPESSESFEEIAAFISSHIGSNSRL
jgi:acetyl esterase/lipase